MCKVEIPFGSPPFPAAHRPRICDLGRIDCGLTGLHSAPMCSFTSIPVYRYHGQILWAKKRRSSTNCKPADRPVRSGYRRGDGHSLVYYGAIRSNPQGIGCCANTGGHRWWSSPAMRRYSRHSKDFILFDSARAVEIRPLHLSRTTYDRQSGARFNGIPPIWKN